MITLVILTINTKKILLSINTALIFFCFSAVLLYLIVNGNVIQSIVTIRFVLLYPLLVLLGGRIYKNSEDIGKLIKIVNIYVIIVAIFGIFEMLNPIDFYSFIAKYNQNYVGSLYRSGIGFGLGSIYGERVLFAVTLCLGIVLLNFSHTEIVDNSSMDKILRRILSLTYLMLIIFTVNRTAILTALIICLYYVFVKKHKISFANALMVILILTTTIIIIGFTPIFDEVLHKLGVSVSAIDITLSGRTDNWISFMKNKASVMPNFIAFGKSEQFNKYLGAADSLYIKLIVSYGFISIPILSLAFLKLIVISIISKNELLIALLIMFFLLSISLDTTTMIGMAIPVYIIAGYYYKKLQRQVNNIEKRS
jgi:hypothetical protein